MTTTRVPRDAALAIEATSARSRNVRTPGSSAPAMGKRIAREPVANTSLAKESALPSASVTVRAARSTAVAAAP